MERSPTRAPGPRYSLLALVVGFRPPQSCGVRKRSQQKIFTASPDGPCATTSAARLRSIRRTSIMSGLLARRPLSRSLFALLAVSLQLSPLMATSVCDLSRFSQGPTGRCANWDQHPRLEKVTSSQVARASSILSTSAHNCTHVQSGVPFHAYRVGRRDGGVVFASGLGNFSMLDLNGRPVHITVQDTTAHLGDHGMNHVVIPALMHTHAKTETVALRIAKEPREQCHPFWQHDEDSDIAISLSGAPAWPTLHAVGCCPYLHSPGGASSGEAARMLLLVTVRPLRRPFSVKRGIATELPGCSRHSWGDRACALHVLRSSLRAMHELLEYPLRVQLYEHASYDPDSANQPTHLFNLAQFCQDPHDGVLSICDVDHALWVPRRAFAAAPLEPGEPPPRRPADEVEAGTPPRHEAFSTMRWVPWIVGASSKNRAHRPHNDTLYDPLHILLSTLLDAPHSLKSYEPGCQPCRASDLAELVPELVALALEVEARHLAIEAGCVDARQLDFACAHERLSSPSAAPAAPPPRL
jgi:hypothetical protein